MMMTSIVVESGFRPMLGQRRNWKSKCMDDRSAQTDCAEKRRWLIRISEKPKLRLYMRIKDQLCEEEYLNLGDSWTRRLLTNLRAGSSELQIEIGRRQNEPL